MPDAPIRPGTSAVAAATASPVARRAALALPLLTALPARAAPPAIPPFREWIGRTALLRGDGGAARLLLAADRTGLMAVRLFLFCRSLPIRSWDLAEDGLAVRYRRVSALDAGRLVSGEARILQAERQLLWIEATPHLAEFHGFGAPDMAGHCG